MNNANTTLYLKNEEAFSIANVLTNNAYMVISKYTNWAVNTTFSGTPEDDTQIWREMIYGKKIANTDVAYLVDNVPWETGVVYEAYTQNASPIDTSFHVITDERKVYKCLFNADGANSTSKPTSTVNTSFTAADGYIWKYMFTVSADSIDKFGDDDYMPIEANSTIESAAVSGTIDAIEILASGNNWTAHNNGAVLEKVSNTVYRVAAEAQQTNGYYNASGFYVSSGAGAGYISYIVNYVSNSSGNYVQLANTSSLISFGDNYIISPRVKIEGDGTGAVAYSTVNGTFDTIRSITVVNVGSDYTWANITLEASGTSSNSSYIVNPIISPFLGHGANPYYELACRTLAVTVKLSNTDSVPYGYHFGAAGILISPKQYGNVSSAFSNTEFRQNWTANVTLSVSTPTPPNGGELITGQTSGATATIITANTTYIRFGGVKGTFTASEGAISNTTATIFTLDTINTPDLAKQRGRIMAGTYFSPVTRSSTSNERIRFVIKV